MMTRIDSRCGRTIIGHRRTARQTKPRVDSCFSRPGADTRLRVTFQAIPGTGYRMHIIAQCPHCGFRWWLAAAAADRRLRCRRCLRPLKIPDLTDISGAVEVISRARSRLYVDDAGRTYG